MPYAPSWIEVCTVMACCRWWMPGKAGRLIFVLMLAVTFVSVVFGRRGAVLGGILRPGIATPPVARQVVLCSSVPMFLHYNWDRKESKEEVKDP